MRLSYSPVEIIQLGMGLMICFGLAVTTLNRGHIAVDLIAGIAPNLLRIWLTGFAALVTVIFIGLMTWRLWGPSDEFLVRRPSHPDSVSAGGSGRLCHGDRLRGDDVNCALRIVTPLHFFSGRLISWIRSWWARWPLSCCSYCWP